MLRRNVIFFVPEKAEEQFSEVFETYKSPHNSPFIISRRTYSPFESFENVNKQDFIVLCIDVSKTLRLGDEDGEYNAFLWKAKAKFGSNALVAVLLKGMPIDYDRFLVVCGRPLSDFDNSGKLWFWHTVVPIGNEQQLLRFMKIVVGSAPQQTQSQTQLNWVLVVFLIAVIVVLVAIAANLLVEKSKGVAQRQQVNEKQQQHNEQQLQVNELQHLKLTEQLKLLTIRDCLQAKLEQSNADKSSIEREYNKLPILLTTDNILPTLPSYYTILINNCKKINGTISSLEKLKEECRHESEIDWEKVKLYCNDTI